jgi:hypothetical protein
MIFRKMFALPGFYAKKAIPEKAIERGTPTKHRPSPLLAGFGAVTPRSRPEDFQMMREAFETGVARENAF